MTVPLLPGCDAAAARLLTSRMRRLKLAETLKGIKVCQNPNLRLEQPYEQSYKYPEKPCGALYEWRVLCQLTSLRQTGYPLNPWNCGWGCFLCSEPRLGTVYVHFCECPALVCMTAGVGAPRHWCDPHAYG
jgi:hypothetical protein